MQTVPIEFSRNVYTVTRLIQEARATIEESFPPLWVEGEISNLARPASGHLYFSLKDRRSQVRCAMFRSRNNRLKFEPENGLQVLLRAQVSLYEARGEFQLVVERMEPAGEGALRIAFEQLKRRLAAEGLFAEEHKQELPIYPSCIGVVTSPTGAAIRDILTILKRRFPLIPVVIYPTAVQGEGAGKQIAQAIELADRRGECEVLIVTRGGGSLEDLWAFNEEVVARALFHCRTPTVSAVGHEIDSTIADYVADIRAPTPSAAAELVSPDQVDLSERVAAIRDWLRSDTQKRLQQHTERVGSLGMRVVHPGQYLQQQVQRLDDISQRLYAEMRSLVAARSARVSMSAIALQRTNPMVRVQQASAKCNESHQRLSAAFAYRLAGFNSKLANLSRALDTVSPLATLKRGYAIVTKRPQNTVVRYATELSPGDEVKARLGKGYVTARIEQSVPDISESYVDRLSKKLPL